jgi:predicted transcriptional regulator
MPKTVTLRLNDEVYKVFFEAAKAENRSLSNLIETAALSKLREQQFADDAEVAEIMANEELMQRIAKGSQEAHVRKGRFIE